MESSIKALSKYRYESSSEALADAIIMYENGRYKNALNRAYYSIFHAVRAVYLKEPKWHFGAVLSGIGKTVFRQFEHK